MLFLTFLEFILHLNSIAKVVKFFNKYLGFQYYFIRNKSLPE